MSYDDDWPDNTMENRRVVVRKTIRPATLEELKELGCETFPRGDRSLVRALQRVSQTKLRPRNSIRAETPEGAEIIYCRDAGQGVWFLPGKGMGIIQPKGLQMLAEIVDAL